MKSLLLIALSMGIAAPKWSSITRSEELTKNCQTEKNVTEKLRVCTFVVNHYSRQKSSDLPIEAKEQAQYVIDRYKAKPKDITTHFGLDTAYQTLGLVAVKENNLKAAGEFLMKSADVPLTPPVQTMPPSMSLSKELLAKGQKDIVLQYLDKIEKVWTAEDAKESLDKWRSEIKAGKTPEFK